MCTIVLMNDSSSFTKLLQNGRGGFEFCVVYSFADWEMKIKFKCYYNDFV